MAQIAAAGLLFLLHVVAARVLDQTLYGAFSFGLTLGAALTLLCTLGFTQLLLKHVAAYHAVGDHARLKGILLCAVSWVLPASAAVTALLAALAWISGGTDDGRAAGLAFASIVALFYSAGLLRSKASRGLDSIMGSIVPEDILRPALLLGGLLLLGWLASGRVEASSVAVVMVLACALSLAAGGAWLHALIPFRWNNVQAVTERRGWLRAAGRIMTGGLAQEVTMRSDIVALGLLATMVQTAEYSAGARLAVVLSLVLKAVDIYYAPRMAVAFQRGEKHQVRHILFATMGISAAVTMPGALLLVLFPRFFLSLFGPEYAAGAIVLQILAVGHLVSAATGSVGYGLLMTGRERLFTMITVGVAILNVTGHALFTSRHGAVAAALVTTCSLVLQNLVMLVALTRGLSRP